MAGPSFVPPSSPPPMLGRGPGSESPQRALGGLGGQGRSEGVEGAPRDRCVQTASRLALVPENPRAEPAAAPTGAPARTWHGVLHSGHCALQSAACRSGGRGSTPSPGAPGLWGSREATATLCPSVCRRLPQVEWSPSPSHA